MPIDQREVGYLLFILANPVRQKILLALMSGPARVGHLARAMPIRRPGVSRQLGYLRDAGLVVRRREGDVWVYHLAPDRLVAVAAFVEALLVARTAPRAAA